mgnify:CR=1 FL=1|tara:strand:+ start:3105 stop:3740 length:636 start_codon:yes stop_codon:yes gene_type:complete
MHDFRSAVPVVDIQRAVPGAIESTVADDVSSFLAKQPEKVPPTCLYIWDQAVHRGRISKPFKIAPIVNNGNVGIYDFVTQELGRPAFIDAYSVTFAHPVTGYDFAEVSLVQCYPDDIHICDVAFSDTTAPLSPSQSEIERRGYRGLHVFGQFIDQLATVARDRGVGRLSLMVASRGLPPVFARYGFKPSKTKAAKAALKSTGFGYPMILRL